MIRVWPGGGDLIKPLLASYGTLPALSIAGGVVTLAGVVVVNRFGPPAEADS